MPAGVVTNAREEHKWERAKQIAAEEGHEKDWQYIMGIYKRMNPNRFNKQASLAAYLLKAAATTETPQQRGAKYQHIGNLQRTINVGKGATPQQSQAALNQWNTTYNARYNNLANARRMSLWQSQGKTPQQIQAYVNKEVMKSMQRDGLVQPMGGLGTMPTPAPRLVSTPVSRPPVPASSPARPRGVFRMPPENTYVPAPSTVTNPDGSISRSVFVPPVQNYNGPARGARSVSQIRNDTAAMNKQFRNSNFVWDPKTKAYNFTGMGNGSIDAAQELARLRHIYNGMNRAERFRYRDQWKARMRALEPYRPIEHFSY